MGREVSGGRRPRLVLAVTIYRETIPRPLPRIIQLKQSLFKMRPAMTSPEI